MSWPATVGATTGRNVPAPTCRASFELRTPWLSSPRARYHRHTTTPRVMAAAAWPENMTAAGMAGRQREGWLPITATKIMTPHPHPQPLNQIDGAETARNGSTPEECLQDLGGEVQACRRCSDGAEPLVRSERGLVCRLVRRRRLALHVRWQGNLPAARKLALHRRRLKPRWSARSATNPPNTAEFCSRRSLPGAAVGHTNNGTHQRRAFAVAVVVGGVVVVGGGSHGR
jgi:hypothetical protein